METEAAADIFRGVALVARRALLAGEWRHAPEHPRSFGGWAAILAGVLRAGGSLVSGGSEVERQSLYFIVDLLLLLGVFAAHAQNHEALGRWGAAGFLTTVAGILLVRSSRAVSGLDLYPAGSNRASPVRGIWRDLRRRDAGSGEAGSPGGNRCAPQW